MFNTLIFLLFSQLAIGGIWSVSLVPDLAGKSFFRFCGLACALLLAIGLFTGEQHHSLSLWGLVASLWLSCIFVGLIVCERPRQARRVLLGSGLAGAFGLAAYGFLTTPEAWPHWVAYASIVYQLSSALFLGSVIFGMILGHWYLIVPTLPIAPLRKLTQLMIIATGIKAVLLGMVIYLGASSTVPEIAETVEGFARLQGLFFWARSLFGLIGPIVICYMTWETVKLNATQSATGLLYVATVLVLIGETLSRYIYYTTHLPV